MQEQLKQPKENVKFEQKPYANGEDENDNETDEGDEPMILMTEVIGDLLDSREFMQGVVDKIMNETNLSEVIFKIDPIIKENQELRALIHSQQETLNQMNIMILKFLNTQAQIMLSNESNSNSNSNSKPDVSVIDEIPVVTTDCNEDGLYEDWQNSVESQAQVQQAQFDEEQHDDQDEQPDEDQQDEEQLQEKQPDQQELEEVQLEVQQDEEQLEAQPEEVHKDEVHKDEEQLEEVQLEEQLTTEVVESIENEVDATSDNEAPSFPDMDRLKLLVSEIPASDM
jgi:flagellar biosynthesis GTPase FlhF